VIWGNAIDQLHDPVTSVAESDLADEVVFVRLGDRKRRTLKGQFIPPSREPVIDEANALRQCSVRCERQPHSFEPTVRECVSVERRCIGRGGESNADAVST
jgi:hypothetical protein